MRVFISNKDTAKLYVQFLDQNNPKSKYQCRKELIYVRGFEVINKTRSCVLSLIKHSFSFFNSTRVIILGLRLTLITIDFDVRVVEPTIVPHIRDTVCYPREENGLKMVGFHWAYQASLQAKYTYLLNIFLENSFFFHVLLCLNLR